MSDKQTKTKHTPGPWKRAVSGPNGCPIVGDTKGLMICMLSHSVNQSDQADVAEANAALIIAAPDLLAALEEGRRAIGDHNAPSDCYATGPMTGDDFISRVVDLVQCPACSFIAMYDAAIAKAKGQ